MTPLNVVIAGASGFLGSQLTNRLASRGHSVVRLVRKDTSAPDESSWDPYAARVDTAVIESADVVINLAGSPLVGNVHSKKWARELRESRVTTTAVLADAIAASERKPAYLAGNGIAYYGNQGDTVLTEDSPSTGDALLTQVTREWQEAAQPAADAGARVAILRTSPVMDAESDPLKKLKLLFKLGLGGKLGSGEQYMPMLSLRDWTAAVTHLAEHHEAAGPFNLVSPQTPTNAEFTKALAEALNRPSFATVPAVIIDKAAGDLSSELLGSVNARPEALTSVGYEFADREVHAVISAGLRTLR